MKKLICSDPDWNNGRYYGNAVPRCGLAQALIAAVPLWMSRETMEYRFGRKLHNRESYAYSLDTEFAVEAYLDGVADRAPQVIDPNALLYLMRATTYFDLPREYGGLWEALEAIRARVLLISYASDWRYPPAEVQRIQETLEELGKDSRHVVLDSPVGHSAFLHDVASCAEVVTAFLSGKTTNRSTVPTGS
jgi:homoserine O-acetyltransferase